MKSDLNTRLAALLFITQDLYLSTALVRAGHSDPETDHRLAEIMEDCEWLRKRLERNKTQSEADHVA